MNKGHRIINMIIDQLVISIVTSIIVALFVKNGLYFYVWNFSIYVLYYVLLEFLIGQTLGKMLTKTIVVDLNNAKPSFIKILIRTISRFIPLDVTSYLFGFEVGMHDALSQTKLRYKTN